MFAYLSSCMSPLCSWLHAVDSSGRSTATNLKSLSWTHTSNSRDVAMAVLCCVFDVCCRQTSVFNIIFSLDCDDIQLFIYFRLWWHTTLYFFSIVITFDLIIIFDCDDMHSYNYFWLWWHSNIIIFDCDDMQSYNYFWL